MRHTPLLAATITAVALTVAAVPAAAQLPPDRLAFGGGIGLAFGDVDFVEIAPWVGYRVTPQLSLGLGALYRYRDDSRYPGGLSTSDYGASGFARLHVNPWLYLQGEVEYLSYQYRTLDGTKDRDDETSVLGGAGLSQPVGPRTFLHATVLYNFSYSSGSVLQPYDSPWVYRIGISVGF